MEFKWLAVFATELTTIVLLKQDVIGSIVATIHRNNGSELPWEIRFRCECRLKGIDSRLKNLTITLDKHAFLLFVNHRSAQTLL
jgi:hypothetical protein